MILQIYTIIDVVINLAATVTGVVVFGNNKHLDRWQTEGPFKVTQILISDRRS
jgi:hypothetical protein